MNWGLTLALVGFLLPLSLLLRIALSAVAGETPPHPVRLMRGMLACLLLAIVAGKLPATIYAVTGDYQGLGRATEAFMVTPIGVVHMAAIVVGVLAADLFGPGLTQPWGSAQPRSTLGRSIGIIAGCLLLGWLGAR